ncbi:MAG: tetratricopeptide repeat protein [Desertifilum sp. SIO1I2]|nr:tetratricopeptide repeat protein [Desertifilum sp. SIO1I2]
MGANTDYAQEYQQAETAYVQGRYEEAASTIDRLVEIYPDDPSARLLRGHIYCYGLQQYELAIDEYESVKSMASDPVFVEYANQGIDYALQYTTGHGAGAAVENGSGGYLSDENFDEAARSPLESLDTGDEFDDLGQYDLNAFEDEGAIASDFEDSDSFDNPFAANLEAVADLGITEV